MKTAILLFLLLTITVTSVYGLSLTEEAMDSFRNEDYDAAIKTGLKAIKAEGGFDAHLITGAAYYKKGKPDKAIPYLEKAKTLAQTNEKSAAVYNFLGLSYYNIRKVDKALYYFSQQLKIARELGDKKATASGLNNIAGILRDKGDLDKALEYYKESLQYLPTDNLVALGTIYNNIGNIYAVKKDYLKAIDYYKKAIDYAQKGEYYLGVGPMKLNLGETYRKVKDYQNAKKELIEGLKMVQATGKKIWEGSGCLYLARLYQNLGQYETAKNYCLKAREIFKNIGMRDGFNQANLLLSSISPWAVYLEAYKNKDAAYKRLQVLREKGYQVMIKEVKVPQKGTWYRIFIGGFKNKEDAYKKRDEVKKDFPGAWVGKFEYK
ncbi:MAG: tetratricopeptide repeat protein [Candidatus Desulfofervidus auxilii]|nr:tetratricopeptide repeat protein [Candidatus Desulfofervidus auxilii]